MARMRQSFFLLIVLTTVFATSPFFPALAQNVEERRAQLEKELKHLEAQIQEQQDILNTRAQESVTLERDIAILNATIEKARLSIRARSLEIERLSKESGEKQVVIEKLGTKIDREKESIGELIRKADKADSFSLPEIVLGGRNFSEFFQDIEEYQVIKRALRDSYTELATDKKETEVEREALDIRRTDEVQLRRLQELEKKKIEAQEAEKKRILKISKGIEAEYQKIIKIKQLSTAQIRAELFTLRGSATIPFGRALEYANTAGKKTGVRPALILGVIAEESNLGENVGTGNWRVDMKVPRDTEPFLDITRRLGLDPDNMPVSKKPWYGYGGAMGPAQFIPSTWVLYEERIAKATGHNPPNPWDPFDAFMAAALLLMDNGADKNTPAAERLAALRYFAGWQNANKKAYAFYGDDVMELAEKYQRQIDILSQNS
ncbi:MAG: hypothetical protein A2W52_01385 [Candidatus Taylorbacteria bacterium RIFCSPHIGHO2_02_49_25]|uniref:Uncharacterized protein n=1 Tax=Candidatus Taylorbacteria bacterium RIFCSPHIGHO2_02_49_25 TaxID=1802305 RepID=A0A1G2MG26_9BACT|nr:MAG: hypothetical protein A2759_02410 [Candidatus Taylorbacteria bacterium RIFCSPHIGHO2_01_FULL_49_60]OHA21952.1 MAG: hypothetical protein A2W52_01385 [Candidatus Taylorbacteria bacterium RIFCSPHIGHO2_02_49_25]OHA45932.1 MAG: hypothetical protein A3G61_00110 [Candidatus Taylorbacteria bacterium RIFCSPLOWO2_12_FULL_49_67]HCB35806.1 hypothetical protein [Candidatus Taylorbacteria bacterium]